VTVIGLEGGFAFVDAECLKLRAQVQISQAGSKSAQGAEAGVSEVDAPAAVRQ
jgi:hypothetical protein